MKRWLVALLVLLAVIVLVSPGIVGRLRSPARDPRVGRTVGPDGLLGSRHPILLKKLGRNDTIPLDFEYQDNETTLISCDFSMLDCVGFVAVPVALLVAAAPMAADGRARPPA